MRKIILTSLIIFSPSIFAHDLPNTFEAGDPIVASEVNENFAELKSEIDELRLRLESQSNNELSRAFVGFSSIKTTGDAGGYYGINQICQTEYADSTICTNEDYLRSPWEPTQNAWLNFINRKQCGGSGSTFDGLDDESCISPNIINCSGWHSNSTTYGTAPALKQIQGFSTLSCANEASVACCK